MSFYANVFDPKLVIAQIIAMQCLSYLSLSALIWLFHELFATPFTLDQIFDYRSVGWDTPSSAAASAAILLNSLLIGVQMSFIVERAKKCLDFAFTLYFIHFLASWKIAGFPLDWRWWGVHIVAMILSSICGEFLCMKKELQEINMNEFLSVRL